jgi:hypothetical protein
MLLVLEFIVATVLVVSILLLIANPEETPIERL